MTLLDYLEAGAAAALVLGGFIGTLVVLVALAGGIFWLIIAACTVGRPRVDATEHDVPPPAGPGSVGREPKRR